jgi:phosphatidylserine decarboxylase
MKIAALVEKLTRHDGANFLLTNRIPRRALTRFMAWFSRIEQPFVRDLSIGTWQLFGGDLNLHEARQTTFRSLHDCFVRELKVGARPINTEPGVVVSPCDGIVGASGIIQGRELVQAKGITYTIDDLFADSMLAREYRGGSYVTLRLTSTMYHRFHAPYDCDIDEVTYIAGDTWNVNPPALARVARLYCKNERAVLHAQLRGSTEAVTLVPVAAILVAGIYLNFLDPPLNLDHTGHRRFVCRASFDKGDELGHFRHGSTIIAFATSGLDLVDGIVAGHVIRMGQPLFRHR